MGILNSKTIIVTGGSGLIGSSIIKDLTNSGAQVFNLDIIEPDELHGSKFIHCDLTNTGEVKEVLLELNKTNTFWGLVNNSYPRTQDWNTKFDEINFNSWNSNLEIQLGSLFYITQQFLKCLKPNEGASIVNMASIYGFIAPDFDNYSGTNFTMPAAYSAIKGGVINFTKFLASLYGSHGVRINAISPGGVFNNQNEKFVQKYSSKVPLGRMATPKDIAPAVRFLLSDESEYITGQNFVIDGGYSIK